MKTVSVTRRAKSVQALLRQALKQNLILRSPDGHEFILAEVDDFGLEIELTRRNKQLMAFLDRRARQTKTVSWNEAKARLG